MLNCVEFLQSNLLTLLEFIIFNRVGRSSPRRMICLDFFVTFCIKTKSKYKKIYLFNRWFRLRSTTTCNMMFLNENMQRDTLHLLKLVILMSLFTFALLNILYRLYRCNSPINCTITSISSA